MKHFGGDSRDSSRAKKLGRRSLDSGDATVGWVCHGGVVAGWPMIRGEWVEKAAAGGGWYGEAVRAAGR